MSKKSHCKVFITVLCIFIFIYALKEIFLNDKPRYFYKYSDSSIKSTEVLFPVKHIHLDTIYLNKKYNVIFPYMNTGNNFFKLYHLNTSCGCKRIKNTKKYLMPGECDTLELTIIKNDVGSFQESISVFGNSDSVINILISGYTKIN